MQRNAYKSLLFKRLLIALATLSLPFFIVSQTKAKVLAKASVNSAIAIVSLADMAGTNIKNPAQVKARLLYLMKHNPKAVRTISKDSLCAALTFEERAGFGSCFKNCVREVGISAVQLIMCGAACVAAWTGAGALACAVCVGVSVTIINTCAFGCLGYGKSEEIIIEEDMTRNRTQPRAPSRTLQAKLRLKPALAQAK